MVARAKEILKQIESGGMELPRPVSSPDRFESDDGQMTLMPSMDNELIRRLKNLDVNTLTPIEALQTLYEICKEAGAY